jgi:hypothetical protein
MHSSIQFGLQTALLWLTVIALWLGAIQSVRFAQLPLPYVLGLAAAGTIFWFRRMIPVFVWYTAGIMTLLIIGAAVFLPATH